MNTIFFGSSIFSTTILDKLHKAYPISAVVTQPDRPKGRKGVLTPTPVKEWVTSCHCEEQSDKDTFDVSTQSLKKSRDTQSREKSSVIKSCANQIELITHTDINKIYFEIKLLHPDLIIVAAYGPPFLSKEILNLPKYGCLNVHPSLLPKYRGASPIPYALLFGEKETGVTIFKMNEEIDKGEILIQKKITIGESDNSESLTIKLAKVGADLLIETIPDWIKGKIKTIPQTKSVPPYARKLTKDDGFIPFDVLKKAINGEKYTIPEIPFYSRFSFKPTTDNRQLITLVHFVCAMSPWPGAWTLLPNGKRLKILKAHNTEHSDRSYSEHSDYIIIDEVQLESKKPISNKKDIASLMLAMTK